MKWITRARPKTDRIACPWLIRRFIDPAAEIVYVPAPEVLATAEREGGHSFDAPGAEFTHRPAPGGRGEWCTFETLIAEHHLDDPALAPPAGCGSFGRYFLGLGTWGCGGPIATVGYMQRDLVERRNWMTRADFLDGVALGQTMPGPLAAQVAMWVGYLRRGTLGALAVAAAFIAPSFFLVLTVAAIYRRYSGLPIVQSLFYGIPPVVVAIIAVAAWKLAKLTNKADRRLWAISLALMLVTAITGAEIAYLFIAAGLLMLLSDAPPRRLL